MERKECELKELTHINHLAQFLRCKGHNAFHVSFYSSYPTKQTGSKSGKGYGKAVCCHPAYLTYMQSTSGEMPGWIKHKLESRFPGEIPMTSDMQMTSP